MKRVRSAMLQQVLCFVLSDKLTHDEAVRASAKEADDYLARLERAGTAHRVLSRSVDKDGATVLEVRRQYNSTPTGDYI